MNLAAVIIENRPDHLKRTIDNHFPFLPDGTVIYVFGSPEIRAVLDFDCRFVHLKGKVDNHIYNNILASAEFWKTFDQEHVLIIQSDSGLLRTGVEEFMEYDFIGAPLYHFPFPAMNGGLSLRRKSAMLRVVAAKGYAPYSYNRENEDIYFTNVMAARWPEFHLPNKETAMKFSCETIFGLGSLGYHAIDKYLTAAQCQAILNQYKVAPGIL